jgi:hypothetical protein
MLIITDPSDVDEPQLQRLLRQRFEQLSGYDFPISDLARFHVIQPGDTFATIEDELGFAINTNLVDGICFGHPDFVPSWEHAQRHGSVYEITYILDDSGFGWVLYIQDRDGIDPDLLALCHAYISDDRTEN